jgi:hypothetical protein
MTEAHDLFVLHHFIAALPPGSWTGYQKRST